MTATPQAAAADAAPATAAEGRGAPLALVQALLDAALQAQRSGTFEELVRERPQAVRWLLRRHTRIVRGAAGDALAADALPQTAALLLRWLVTQLRPDAEPGFDAIDADAWLHLQGWRPMLAIAAHAGFVQVPDFPRQYRRHAGEAALDNLCGLWDVGPSTVYRTLEKARAAMAQLLLEPSLDAARRLSLRRLVLRELAPRLGLADDEGTRAAWHRRQADAALASNDPASALWHRWQAGDADGCIGVLRKQAVALAAEPETDAIVERLAATALSARAQVDLWLARAALARTRNAAERELRALERARAVAQAAQDRLLLGIVHSALGKFYEPRDGDRAFACYQDSAEFLRDLGPASGDLGALEHFVTTYARLAWLYILRNDDRSKAVLDRAEALRSEAGVPDEVLGMLEQVWGEYWRRAGDAARSLEHRYRALNIFERIGDRRSVLATMLNLVQIHGQAGDHERALRCAQVVFDAARGGGVEPALLASTHLNLGAAHFWRGDLHGAIGQYRLALAQSLQAGLNLHAFRARYNLAEAHYTRFRDGGDADDERLGDGYVAAALAAPQSDSSPAAIQSAKELKSELLGAHRVAEPERLLPGDSAAHVDEMAEIQRQRRLLSEPGEADRHARAHLAIARAYAVIAAKEREAARALVERHGLQAAFRAEFDVVRQAFERELTREQQLAAGWKKAAGDVLDDARRAAVVAALLRDGAVGKSGFAQLAGVAPATASKHLATLAERGLLVQRGKGPSTRYELPG